MRFAQSVEHRDCVPHDAAIALARIGGNPFAIGIAVPPRRRIGQWSGPHCAGDDRDIGIRREPAAFHLPVAQHVSRSVIANTSSSRCDTKITAASRATIARIASNRPRASGWDKAEVGSSSTFRAAAGTCRRADQDCPRVYDIDLSRPCCVCNKNSQRAEGADAKDAIVMAAAHCNVPHGPANATM